MTNGKLSVDHVTDLKNQRPERWGRREFVKGLSALAGSAGLLGYDPRPAAAEPPPETTKIRLVYTPGICPAPAYIAEDLLRTEGFADVQYIDDDANEIGTSKPVATGKADLSMSFGLTTLIRVDAGEPVVLLAGVHTGCYELFGTERVRSIRDLRGSKVAIPGFGSTHHLFLSVMASFVGVDPRRDINWVTLPREDAKRQLAEGKIDALLGFPPDPQELRAKKIGRVVVNTTTDEPWSQYFCCMVISNREFVQRNPVAAKRALRAILKAADLCASDPNRAARFLVERGYAQNQEYALQTMRDIPYRKWREYSPEDSVRFFGLRLHEVGMIKSSPQKLIAQGTDWRFLNELRRELKA